jgi:hypothetical protein
MQVTLTIPDELAAQLIAAGKDPSRAALEALAVEGYRTQRLSENRLASLLDYCKNGMIHHVMVRRVPRPGRAVVV